MSHVRSSGSAIEVALGRALWAAGFRYRKQYQIFGRPDFVLVRDRVAIFCDSEFWHGHRWGSRRKAEHKTNQAYWFAKIERNRARDRTVNRELRRAGWVVVRFWEHEINHAVVECVGRVAAARAGTQELKPKAQRVQCSAIDGRSPPQRAEHPDYEPDLNFKKAKAESDAEQQTLI